MRDTEIKDFIKSNWGKINILEIQAELNINLYSILQIALELNLQDIETDNTKRRWTEDEDRFLKEHSEQLSIYEACNLLHRSRYATYQRVKLLNLNEMINKKNKKRG